jgi:ABC-type branched-subunit amino acid transport system ATPase component
LILQLQHINFGFIPEKQILKDLTLDFEEKKIYALMGSNGAGKTTLFNLVTGFFKLKSGKVIFNGVDITNKKPYRINRYGIGRTFQDLRLITKLTVKENIVLAMQHNPTDSWLFALLPESFKTKSNQELDKKANELLNRFFLDDVIDSLAGDISYGQQKLLSLACCVANGASLFLLDEPVAGIQPEYRNKMIVLLKQLKEEGKTILMIEHNTDFIANVADKILFLHEGTINAFENIELLRNDKQVMEAYI